MKRATDIVISNILLILILLGTAGVSVERCSCTGNISLVLVTEGECCPDEGSCMTVKSMQLSDYVPTMTASLDMPLQPVLFPVFPPISPAPSVLHTCQTDAHSANAPPEALAHTVTVLRV